MKAKYQFEIKNGEEKQELKIEAKSYAEAFRQFWTHFINTDLIKTIETIDLANIRTSDSEFFVAVNGQKKKNIAVTPTLWVYTHLTPKAMEKAYDKFMKGWNGEITAPVDDVTAMPETNDDLSELHTAIDKEIEQLNTQPQEENLTPEPETVTEPEAQPEEPVKKLTPAEERKAKTAAILAAQREEKRKKKEAAAARKLAKQQAQKSQEETQEELELPNM